MSLPAESDENWVNGPQVLADFLKEKYESGELQGALVQHEPGQMDVSGLLAEGWTMDDKVDFVAGKRIRYIHPPEVT